MDSVIIFTAQYLLYIMVAGFAVAWLMRTDRSGKLNLALSAVIGLILIGVFIYVAGALHDDPRPFMLNRSLNNMLDHADGNGFPSDHSAAAGLIAGLVLLRNRAFGAVLAVAAVLIAASRVAAHAHHVQDVVAGLAMGALAAWLATLLATMFITRFDIPARLGRKGKRSPDRHKMS